MEQNCVIHGKKGPGFPSGVQLSYSTEHRAPSPPVSSPSWFSNRRTRRAVICGVISTLLSAIGLIGLALFEQYNGMLSELRADLKHFNETASDYIKRDRFEKCLERLKECMKEVRASEAARERLDHELKTCERTREVLARDVQRLRERLAYVEGMKVGLAGRPSAPSMHLQPDEEDSSPGTDDRE
jgi:hypothetical protein